jgi:hypothetical protein
MDSDGEQHDDPNPPITSTAEAIVPVARLAGPPGTTARAAALGVTASEAPTSGV